MMLTSDAWGWVVSFCPVFGCVAPSAWLGHPWETRDGWAGNGMDGCVGAAVMGSVALRLRQDSKKEQ
ncbi:hypothetical protein HDK64DRAFT_274034 [Phyllosticta capitalensis]